jgi:DNA-binding winged helix-turn-helix (wHTH) protein
MSKKRGLILEDNYPLSYRQTICRQIFTNIEKLESFSVIGIEDNSKINLLRFIAYRKDAQKLYLHEKSEDFFFIIVDVEELEKQTVSSLYVMLNWYLIDWAQEHISLRSSETLFQCNGGNNLQIVNKNIRKISEKTSKTPVIIVNNFDKLSKKQQVLFADYIGVMYAQAVHGIVCILVGIKTFDGNERFLNRIVWIPPFKSKAAHLMVSRYAERYRVALSFSQKQKILLLSGGHAGLTKYLVQRIAFIANNHSVDECLSESFSDPDITFQCSRIASTLSSLEKAKLISQVKDTVLLNLGIQRLADKGYEVFSPLLKHYLIEKEPPQSIFTYDKELDEIYYFGKPYSRLLTEKEFTTLRYLVKNQHRIIPREELMGHIWGEDEFPSDWALDKLISRLRMKLSENHKNSEILKSIRGKGVSLTK